MTSKYDNLIMEAIARSHPDHVPELNESMDSAMAKILFVIHDLQEQVAMLQGDLEEFIDED